LAEFGLLQLLWPSLKDTSEGSRFMQVMEQTRLAISWFRLLYLKEEMAPWMVWFLAVMADCWVPEFTDFCKRFQLPPKIAKHLIWQKEHGGKIARRLAARPDVSNSEIYRLLQGLSNEGLLYLMGIDQDGNGILNKAVSNYVTNLRGLKSEIDGDDLARLGYPPGPLYKKILDALLDARLDGLIHSRDEELAWLAGNYPPQQASLNQQI